jgi:hypothetical protein
MTNASMDCTIKYFQLAPYRSGTGQGAHSNHFGGVDIEFLRDGSPTPQSVLWVDGQLTSPTTSDLSRKSTSALNGAGIPFPNIRDGGSTNTPLAGTGGPVPDVGHMR